ncbi:MAG: peptidoglycan-binding protein, partial [Chitinispirillaceae bacterium]|nr:peptidoglycan-binding protein [Chitinispirillaceae bacterium]
MSKDEKIIPITRLKKAFQLTTNHKWIIKVTPAECKRLELQDLLFHHNSAVLLPDSPENENSTSQKRVSWEDPDILDKCRNSHPDTYRRYKEESVNDENSGADRNEYDSFFILATLFVYCIKRPNCHILIAGHTDRSGDDTVNFELSKLRALNVLALLQNDRQTWIETCMQKSKIEDYQHILSYLTRTSPLDPETHQKQWNCDPGEIDNVKGPRTTEAIKNFQQTYNRIFDQSIQVDGEVGPQTWEAFFTLYRLKLLETFKKLSDNATMPELPFLQTRSYIA